MSEKKYNSIYQRLVAFQADSPVTKKDETNPFFKSKYAPLDAIQVAIQPILAKHGLGYMFMPTVDGLRAIMFDEDGTTIDFIYPATLSGKPQDIGSNITYAKRYALTAMFGLIVGGDDDDGQEANNQENDPQTRGLDFLEWFDGRCICRCYRYG